MGWSTVYLIIAIIVGILGIWNLARQRNAFLAVAGVLWFLVILFKFFVGDSVYGLVIVQGVPAIGDLILYVVIPALLFFAFLSRDRRV
jgi:hypothetical protein